MIEVDTHMCTFIGAQLEPRYMHGIGWKDNGVSARGCRVGIYIWLYPYPHKDLRCKASSKMYYKFPRFIENLYKGEFIMHYPKIKNLILL